MDITIYYSNKKIPLAYQEAVELVTNTPGKIKFFKDVPEDFVDYLLENGADEFCRIPALRFLDKKYLTKERLKLVAEKYPPTYCFYIPYDVQTEELTIIAVKACNGEPSLGSRDMQFSAYQHLHQEQKTEAVTKAYWESGGRSLSQMPEEHITQKMCSEAIDADARQLPLVPAQLRTQEICEKGMAVRPGIYVKYVPEEFLTADMCTRAVEESWGIAYEFIPQKFRTAQLAMHTLYTLKNKRANEAGGIGIAAGDVVRLTPLSVRTDDFMHLAYRLFCEERNYFTTRPRAQRRYPRHGRPNSTAFAKYIAKMDSLN